ncbi:MAG: RluA family pseudouridine synthase [Candidatus Omnitrophica bacterium]|nr:RluA family pseudouridine synthase [Candidatus Omnitrophota bacterium]
MKEFTLKVSQEEAGQRLDLFLFKFSQSNNLGLSRNLIQNLIKNRNVFCAGKVPSQHYKVKPQEVFNIRIPDQLPREMLSEDIPLDIIFEDDDLIVVNKPVGMVVHPAAGNFQGTLVNALLFHCASLSSVNPERPGIVHRLDKDTSGLIVAAKNNTSHHHLTRQFSQHTVLREYAAVVEGRMELSEDIIELPIGRHPRQREKMSVSFLSDHRYAKTHYKVLKRNLSFSLLQLKPFTGRTHQLRVHLSFIGNPILGDKKYGRNTKFSRLALHAYRLGFIHPRSNKLSEFKIEIPKEFIELLS